MKYLINYKIFESFLGTDRWRNDKKSDISSEIMNVLSSLTNNGFEVKLKTQLPKGPVKRISAILRMPSRIQVIINKVKDQNGGLPRFTYSEIEDKIENLKGYLSGRYTEIGSSASSDDWTTSNSHKTDGKRHHSYVFVFKLNDNQLPIHKKDSNIEHINDVFQDLIDLGIKISVKDMNPYSNVFIENLKPRKTPSSLGGPNEWVALTKEEIRELKDSIDKYIGVYDVSLFDSTVKYKGDANISLKEKVIKTHDELFEFLDNNDILGISLIFKNDE